MLLDPDSIDAIVADARNAVDQEDFDTLAKLAHRISSARLAKALADFPAERLARCLDAIEVDKAGRILGHLPTHLASETLAAFDPARAAALFMRVPADKAADLHRTLPDDLEAALRPHLDERWRAQVLELAAYPPHSAGSAMDPRFVTIEERRTVREAIEALLAASERAERPVYVYAVNGKQALTGVISQRDLLAWPPSTRVSQAMNPNVVAVETDEPAVEAARLLHDRRFMTLPVVTKERRVAGVLTFDDAMDILTQDVAQQFAGVGGPREESFLTGPRGAVRQRLPWMAINIFLNLGAVTVITGFEDTIAQVAILAAFLPMITDMGGNVGIQALSVAIRSLALGEARLRDCARAIRKECAVGVLNGLALGALFALIAFFWRGNLWLGLLAGVALGANVFVAGVVGGALPFLIKRIGKDPAMMTGPFLTTITDITGVSIYLGLSTIFIARLLG